MDVKFIGIMFAFLVLSALVLQSKLLPGRTNSKKRIFVELNTHDLTKNTGTHNVTDAFTDIFGDALASITGEGPDPIEEDLRFVQPKYLDEIRQRANSHNDLMLLTATEDRRREFVNFLSFAQHRRGLSNWVLFCAEPDIPWVKELGLRCHLSANGGPSSWQKYRDQECPKQSKVYHVSNLHECRRRVCHQLETSTCLGFVINRKKECWKCTGDAQRDILRLSAVEGSRVYHYRPRRSIWYTRWQGLKELLSLGFNVLLIDLDAIVKKDPFPVLHKYPDADLVVQRGFEPKSVTLSWGSSICMGFSYWRSSTPKRDAIHDRILDIMKRNGDDQNAANTVLFIEELTFPSDKVKKLDRSLTGTTSTGFKVTLLPQNKFPRRCPSSPTWNQSKVVVAHCYTRYKLMSDLIGLGNWGLRKGWVNVTNNNLTEYLSLVSSPSVP